MLSNISFENVCCYEQIPTPLQPITSVYQCTVLILLEDEFNTILIVNLLINFRSYTIKLCLHVIIKHFSSDNINYN